MFENFILILFSVVVLAIIFILIYTVIDNSITFSSKNLKKIYDTINVGECYVQPVQNKFPSEYSPWRKDIPNMYFILEKKNGWLKCKKASTGEIVECSIKEFVKKNYELLKDC